MLLFQKRNSLFWERTHILKSLTSFKTQFRLTVTSYLKLTLCRQKKVACFCRDNLWNSFTKSAAKVSHWNSYVQPYLSATCGPLFRCSFHIIARWQLIKLAFRKPQHHWLFTLSARKTHSELSCVSWNSGCGKPSEALPRLVAVYLLLFESNSLISELFIRTILHEGLIINMVKHTRLWHV